MTADRGESRHGPGQRQRPGQRRRAVQGVGPKPRIPGTTHCKRSALAASSARLQAARSTQAVQPQQRHKTCSEKAAGAGKVQTRRGVQAAPAMTKTQQRRIHTLANGREPPAAVGSAGVGAHQTSADPPVTTVTGTPVSTVTGARRGVTAQRICGQRPAPRAAVRGLVPWPTPG